MVLQKHYQHLGKISVDSDFDANWKEEVESKVSSYGSMSKSCQDDRLYIAIGKGEIVKCKRSGWIPATQTLNNHGDRTGTQIHATLKKIVIKTYNTEKNGVCEFLRHL